MSSIIPRGMAVQEAYRLYRDNQFLVNRKYQRKLVWTDEEKEKLIDSILKGFPIPLILLAESTKPNDSSKYEIIDGMQRLDAIFSFIENRFSANGVYFDVSQSARAKQLAQAGEFGFDERLPLLSPKECANYLDYQLAVTIYPTSEEKEITEVFGRINSGGKQLSPQEKRQAGMLNPFAEMTKKIAMELRGDDSKDELNLKDMPEVSIGSKRLNQKYGVRADDTFWCKHGVLSVIQLRNSDDEEIIADIAASILLDEPLARSKERLDRLYDNKDSFFQEIENKLCLYKKEKLAHEIKATFSHLKRIIEHNSGQPNSLRQIVSPGQNNPIKSSFYAIFMAFFDLLIKQQCIPDPDNTAKIIKALTQVSKKIQKSSHFSKTTDRHNNINVVKGLIQPYFIKKEPLFLQHGPGLIIDFENSLRRSRVETSRYEFKQGVLMLDNDRNYNDDVYEKIINTICAIANLGKESTGYIFIGVTNEESDANKIKELYEINPVLVGTNNYVVGIDREVNYLNIKFDSYIDKLLSKIKNSQLSEPLKSLVSTNIDTISYKNDLSVIRITVPPQKEVSFVDTIAFVRKGSSTVQLDAREVLAVSKTF
jgi:hypothetical protein